VSGSASGRLPGDASYTVRGSGTVARDRLLLGLGPAGPLHETVDRRSFLLGSAFSGELRKWLWSSTSTFRSDASTTAISAGPGAGGDSSAHALVRALATDLGLTGSPFRGPGGSAQATLRTQYDWQNIVASHPGDAAAPQSSLTRRTGGAFANLNLPLTSRRLGSSPALGDVSINGHVGAQTVSDRGDVYSHGYGASWSPVKAINLYASKESATIVPSLEQLRAPDIVTPNLRTFDLARSETRDVAGRTGGNPGLRDERRDTFQLSLALRPLKSQNLAVSFSYADIHRDRPIETFHILTAPLEAAFPERFSRDASGRLVGVDARPVNLAGADESKLSWGISLTRSLAGSSAKDLIFSPAGNGSTLPNGLPANARIIDNPPGTPLPPDIENAISRVYVSLYYTWRLRNKVVLSPGGPALDLLDGFALNGLGDTPRHQLSFSAGLLKHGLGARLDTKWQSPSTVYAAPGQPGGAGSALRFVYRPVVDLQLFVNPQDRIVGNVPGWIKGVQAIVTVTNLLDLRPRVRDRSGATPLDYQAAYLDPVGRSVKLSVRKIF
jgi:hypothetical protein